MYLMLISGIACFAIGCLFFWVFRFVSNIVRSELNAQKIYFPERGSPEFDSTVYPDLQQYAGQLVDSPKKARAYADGYIGRHLKKIANGKTYAEISTASMKSPDDKKLQQQKQVLFQGEALRGLLLMGGYGFGTIGRLAGIVCYATFTMSGFLVLLYILFSIEM
jgi:hypothetical protein